MRKAFCTLFGLLLLTVAWTQEEMPVQFGKVTPEDFKVVPTGVDSGAGAIVVADYGTCHFEGNWNYQSSVSLIFIHTCRIRIIKREAFDAATIVIPLFTNNIQAEFITGLKASTYNMENGQVVETKLDDNAVFTDRINKNRNQRKFSFPALKEGSIVEYTYRHVSPAYFNLQPWAFQRQYPCLWSEFRAEIPNILQYATLSFGFQPFYISTSENISYKGMTTYRWVMKDVPALKPEPYTTSISNYLARLEFQLARFNVPGNSGGDVMGSWASLGRRLLESENFGADLDKNNNWLDDDLKKINMGAGSDLDRAQKIYEYVRDNFTCTSHDRISMDNPIKTVFKNRNGSEAELNLLLTAMLRHANIAADPVILSTRDNGFVSAVYPLLSRFNYVITRIGNDSILYYLDASEPWLSFGKLPERCYNGYARVLNRETPSSVIFDPDSVKESKITMVILNKEKDGLSGHLQSTPGFNEASHIRQKIRSSGLEEFMKTIRTSYSGELTVSGLEIDSLQHPDDPLEISYDVRVPLESHPDVLYFSPILASALKENPFKAADRRYPVEMPNTIDEAYTLSMDIPDGYVIDELPQSAKVLFKEGQGVYEYLLVKGDGIIQFRSRIKLDQADFKPEDYDMLREFFGYIVKKQSEQIVFKKKKA
jgi:hypothetical protein